MLKNISKDLENEYNMLINSQEAFYNHSVNVALYTKILLNQIKKDYPSYKISGTIEYYIEMASLLHDIGKIKIPLYILNKTEPLSFLEFDLIKKHPQLGYMIINNKFNKLVKTNEDKKFIEICKNVALFHHERFDGSGYPYGIKGDKIPLEAQIIAIVDSFDAMTYPRCYQKPMSKNEAIKQLLNDKKRYNKYILNSFKKAEKELIKTE